MYTIFFNMIYYILKIYSNYAEEDFGHINSFIALFFIAYGNGVGDFKVPTFSTSDPSRTTIILTYLAWLANMVLSNIILLNFVIALIQQVTENVMDSKLIHIYMQRQVLNEEYDLFYAFVGRLQEKNTVLSRVILITCEESAEDHEWKGII